MNYSGHFDSGPCYKKVLYRFSKRGGFTFLEVMVALSIIAIVFVSVYKLNAGTTLMAESASFYTRASLLAGQKLCEIETAEKRQRPISGDHGDFGEKFPDYSYEIQIEDTDSEILGKVSDDFKKITITVLLNEGDASYRLIAYRFFRD